jgi:hypothetical protein
MAKSFVWREAAVDDLRTVADWRASGNARDASAGVLTGVGVPERVYSSSMMKDIPGPSRTFIHTH